MSEELKPCPFCGKAGALTTLGNYWKVACISCQSEGPSSVNREYAVEWWNTRPAPAVQVPEGYALVPAELADMMRPIYWREVYIGSKHMKLSVSYEYAAWRKMMDKLAAAPAPATVATEAVAQGGGVDVEKVMALVEKYGAASSRFGNGFGAAAANEACALFDEIRALLSTATPVSEDGVDYHAVAQFLYGLLDDIDTAGDMAKSDDKLHRSIVESIQARKREVVAECDGYTVKFKAPAIANQGEGE